MKDAYIIDGIRTPIGSYQGTLSAVRTDDLAALVIAEIVKRNPNIPKEAYDDVILGCANQAGEDNREPTLQQWTFGNHSRQPCDKGWRRRFVYFGRR